MLDETGLAPAPSINSHEEMSMCWSFCKRHNSYTKVFNRPSRRQLADATITVNSGPKDILKIEQEGKKKNMVARNKRQTQDNQTSQNPGKRKMIMVEAASDEDKAPATKTKKVKSNESMAKSTRISTSSKSNLNPTDSKNSRVQIAASLTKATDPPDLPRTIQTARCSGRGGASNVSRRKVEDKAETTEKPQRKKQTARRGGIKVTPRTTSPDKPSTQQNQPRKKQTARRGGRFIRGKHETVNHEGKSYHSFNGNDLDGDIEMEEVHGLNEDEPSRYSNPVSASHQHIGPINGVYEIRSSDLDQWSEFPQEEFTLTLCLSGNAIWGAYDFGMYHGILYVRNRASQDIMSFTWRGRERGEGEMSFEEDNEGYIRFLGDGQIEGEINCYGQAKFIGWRINGNNTRQPRSVACMQQEWNGYNADEYERERVARWH